MFEPGDMSEQDQPLVRVIWHTVVEHEAVVPATQWAVMDTDVDTFLSALEDESECQVTERQVDVVTEGL